MRIVAQDGAKSELHFAAADAQEDRFSVERTPSVPAGGGKPAAPARLDFKQGDDPVLSIVNGSMEVAGDIKLTGHDSLASSLAGLSGQQQSHADVVAALLARMETVNGTVDEHDSAVAEHAGHFSSFLTTLNILKERFPYPGVERVGTRSYRCVKTFYAAHRTDIAGGTGTKQVALAAIRQIVPHWGSITMEATVSSACECARARKWRGVPWRAVDVR